MSRGSARSMEEGLSLFITFEGGEGSGKTTQAALLAERLRETGREVLEVHEPGSTPLGKYLRRWLKEGRDPLTAEAELLLFAAARAQLVRRRLRPALERGAVVVCDRYADSSEAYQGHGRGLDLDRVRMVNDLATGGLHPHLTFLLDCPPEVGLRRHAGDRSDAPRDRFEGEGLSFHRRVREGYLEMAQAEPNRWRVLDATRPPQEVARQVWCIVRPLLVPQEDVR